MAGSVERREVVQPQHVFEVIDARIFPSHHHFIVYGAIDYSFKGQQDKLLLFFTAEQHGTTREVVYDKRTNTSRWKEVPAFNTSKPIDPRIIIKRSDKSSRVRAAIDDDVLEAIGQHVNQEEYGQLIETGISHEEAVIELLNRQGRRYDAFFNTYEESENNLSQEYRNQLIAFLRHPKQ